MKNSSIIIAAIVINIILHILLKIIGEELNTYQNVVLSFLSYLTLDRMIERS